MTSKKEFKSENEIAWEKIFQKYKIIEKIHSDGYFNISSKDIKEFREPRLMTKFDHSSQLPTLFAKNKLSILPTSRGTYVISSFETFHKFEKDNVAEIKKINFPISLESLNYANITSEAIAINCSFVSSILSDFTGEYNLYPTVNGRMSSSSFDFSINLSKNKQFKVRVDNSQIEIDGGYEGDNSLNLIEAKNYISDDFLVRQIYYPYRLWSSKVQKKVRSIFLTYTNGLFDLREYSFKNSNDYNSLELVKHKKYIISDGSINIEVIEDILNRIEIIEEPKDIPFPQANSFEHVINLCELLKQKDFLSKSKITENYDFHFRQTDYYINSGRYLGLIDIKCDENKVNYFCLSQKGKTIFNLPITNRQKAFFKLILSHSVFKKVLSLYFCEACMPTEEKIIEIMEESDLNKIKAYSTYKRRASTIHSWINWILNQIEEE